MYGAMGETLTEKSGNLNLGTPGITCIGGAFGFASVGKIMIGCHDFAAFQSSGGTAKTTVRHIFGIDIDRSGDDVTMVVRGSAFLYNMVRIMAGTLIAIGQDRLSPDCIDEALATGNRLVLGVTAPPEGLELTKIFYDLDGDRPPEDMQIG